MYIGTGSAYSGRYEFCNLYDYIFNNLICRGGSIYITVGEGYSGNGGDINVISGTSVNAYGGNINVKSGYSGSWSSGSLFIITANAGMFVVYILR